MEAFFIIIIGAQLLPQLNNNKFLIVEAKLILSVFVLSNMGDFLYGIADIFHTLIATFREIQSVKTTVISTNSLLVEFSTQLEQYPQSPVSQEFFEVKYA